MNIHLCFHGIGNCSVEREPGESRYWITEDFFLRILDQLSGLPDVELSFDDGNKSDVEVALPALRERGLGATFFALAGRLDDPVSLSGADLSALREGGMRIGSHGWRHVPWRGLSEAEAKREFLDARLALEEASGSPVLTAAMPLGQYEHASLRRLRTAGYRAVYTSDRFPSRPSSWMQARYSVTADDTLESILTILRARPARQEARNMLASLVKRIR